MANFTLAITKPEIIANSVEIEREKFVDYLAVTPGKIILRNIVILIYFSFRWFGNNKKMVIEAFRYINPIECRQLPNTNKKYCKNNIFTRLY